MKTLHALAGLILAAAPALADKTMSGAAPAKPGFTAHAVGAAPGAWGPALKTAAGFPNASPLIRGLGTVPEERRLVAAALLVKQAQKRGLTPEQFLEALRAGGSTDMETEAALEAEALAGPLVAKGTDAGLGLEGSVEASDDLADMLRHLAPYLSPQTATAAARAQRDAHARVVALRGENAVQKASGRRLGPDQHSFEGGPLTREVEGGAHRALKESSPERAPVYELSKAISARLFEGKNALVEIKSLSALALKYRDGELHAKVLISLDKYLSLPADKSVSEVDAALSLVGDLGTLADDRYNQDRALDILARFVPGKGERSSSIDVVTAALRDIGLNARTAQARGRAYDFLRSIEASGIRKEDKAVARAAALEVEQAGKNSRIGRSGRFALGDSSEASPAARLAARFSGNGFVMPVAAVFFSALASSVLFEIFVPAMTLMGLFTLVVGALMLFMPGVDGPLAKSGKNTLATGAALAALSIVGTVMMASGAGEAALAGLLIGAWAIMISATTATLGAAAWAIGRFARR